MDKQLYDLKPEDLRRSSVWYFPMDESVQDEMTARELSKDATVPDGLPLIVRAAFTDARGTMFEGYVFADESGNAVEYLKPVLWSGELCVTFWNGMDEPAPDYLAQVAEHLPGPAWPVRYEAHNPPFCQPLEGILQGLYYLSGDEVRFRRID